MHPPIRSKFNLKADFSCRHEGRPRWRADECGVALIIVLSFIVLCTILVVAFFASVTTEGAGQRAAVSETSAMTLAASAVQLMEGTITAATEPTTDTTFAWASQPGMIRTYGTGSAASSDPLAYYKLYSSNNMIISGKMACNNFTGAGTTSLASEVPKYWDNAPPVFTDLNAPLLKVTTSGTTTTTTPIFPIVDPRAVDLSVNGFSISATSTTLDGVKPASGVLTNLNTTDAAARLPMPVRWLYVLADGTLTAPDGPTVPTSTLNNIATWSTSELQANIPKSTNPIVGRVAFWTDDESAKINVNTASEGTYWDTPVASSGLTTDSFSFPQNTGIGDAMLAGIQGAQHEYQRYPGHPATTCLSAVFGSVLNGLPRSQVVQSVAAAIPRISEVVSASSSSASTSLGGSQVPSAYSTSSTQSVTTDRDRLYASLDEFQFTPTRSVQSVGVAATSTSGTPTTEQSIVDTCRFFLTAHSKAPELNLFGLPRVAMWPIWDDANLGKRSTFDQEILRCSTIAQGSSKQHEMIFVRNNPASATTDWTTTQSVGYSTPQPRNQQVYSYLQTLMSRPVPGFGGSFSGATKFGTADRDQVLTEIFDYIRCTNLADQSANNDTSSSYTQTSPPGTTNYNVKLGQVVPIKINATQGSGRILTVAEFALVLVKVDDRKDTTQLESSTNLAGTINVTPSADLGGNALPASINPATQTLVEWTLIPKFFSPMAGYPGLANDFRLHFKNIALSIGGKRLNYAENTVPDLFDVGRLASGGRESDIGGEAAVAALVEQAAPLQSMYPTGLCVVSGVSGASPSSTASIPVSLSFSAQLYAPAGTSMADPARGPLMQEFDNITMPSTTVPIPSWTGEGFTTNPAITWLGTFGQSTYTPGAVASFNYAAATLAGSYPSKGTSHRYQHDWQTFITGNDTIRSMVPTGTLNAQPLQGDMRAVALSPVVDGSTAYKLALTGTGAAPTSANTQVDSLRFGIVIGLGGVHGILFKPPGTALNSTEMPVLPNNVPPQIAANIPADWDNGMGLLPDGPFMNKPDEGAYPSDSGTRVQYIGDYQVLSNAVLTGTTIFSPNRLVSSPVMFGSLPVGADHPWRTLLFRPKALQGYQSLQAGGTYQHPGGTDRTIPDHLLLDLFWMPVVEPYGISEPFVTSGKINLNTQIAPFTYITRTTGLQAVLKSVMMAALNPAATDSHGNGPFISTYKNSYYYSAVGSPQPNPGVTTRYPIDPDKTISQLTTTSPDTNSSAPYPYDYPEFARTSYTAAAPNFFVSASQVCDVPLIPMASGVNGPADIQTFWTNNSLTGDNCLERPYSMIYPRVTTKSNIFTVHVRAQALKKNAGDANQARWQEGKDQILSDYRGSFTIEKYFDPNANNITDSSGAALDPQSDGSIAATAAIRGTKWRLLNVKRFGQ